MSVLIKGIEMPKSCDLCEFCKRDISGYDWCDIPMSRGRMKPLDEPVPKPTWCPLVPVPPHGRLIDADEFLKRAIGTKCFRGDYALMLEELVGESTTIIPAERSE